MSLKHTIIVYIYISVMKIVPVQHCSMLPVGLSIHSVVMASGMYLYPTDKEGVGVSTNSQH